MATHHDAEIILKLYDLRREAVCRQARAWLGGWTPASEAEVRDVANDGKRQENAWLRQAMTYWEMAFSIANHGAVDATLFAKNCGEGIIFCLKAEWLRKKFPQAFTRSMPEAEAFIGGNAIAQKKAEVMRGRFAW